MPLHQLFQHQVEAASRQLHPIFVSLIQAHYINTRTMEVFRSMGGGLAAEVARQSPPLDQWRSFVYCESVTGNILGSVDHFPVRFLTESEL